MESPHHRERQQQTRLLEIDPVALLNDGPKETWEAISDLDAFFGRMYTYYYERGLRCILFSRVISLLTLAFTILLFFFLVEVLDWHAILHECTSEETCQTISIIRSDAFGGMSTYTMLYYYLLFTLYWLWSFVHFLIELRPLLEMHALFRDKLKIDDADLHVISWDEQIGRAHV
jgi:autophagy-related protein 9